MTPETADHNQQIADYGFDLGGPIVRDRAWAWGSWTKQDIRLIRQAGTLDRTVLETWNIKGNWQATPSDMVSFLWFNGDKIKLGRLSGVEQRQEATTTWTQGNNYPDNPFHGLWKLENNRVFTSNLFTSFKYAYYGTGFQLAPAGGLDMQAARDWIRGELYGSWQGLFFLRPQHTVAIDAHHYRHALGGTHDFKFGFGWRQVDAYTQTIWPGNMMLADIVTPDDSRAWVYREGAGTDRTRYLNLYVGDTFQRDRLTVDVGVRYDRQGGSALPSSTESNRGLPDLVPGSGSRGTTRPSRGTTSPRGSAPRMRSTRRGGRWPGRASRATPGSSTPAQSAS